MTNEIELKLLFSFLDHKKLIDCFNDLAIHASTSKQLINRYYDTPDFQLRRWDMGLRIREVYSDDNEDFLEQTIKTSGRVIGGLHQRDEYNITLTPTHTNSVEPVLSLFPATIWPNSADVTSTQEKLICLFNTDFKRTCWHISYPQDSESAIEVALDMGEISSSGSGNNKTQTICELELELIKGSADSLFDLAQYIAEKVPVRLFEESKAKRGYMLFKGQENSNSDINQLLMDIDNALQIMPESHLHISKKELQQLLEIWLKMDVILDDAFAKNQQGISSEFFNAVKQSLEKIITKLATYFEFYLCSDSKKAQLAPLKNAINDLQLNLVLLNEVDNQKLLQFRQNINYGVLQLSLLRLCID